VDDALAEAGDDEAAVRNALERLGSPEEIAAAAGPEPAARPRRGPLETIAPIVLLACAGVIGGDDSVGTMRSSSGIGPCSSP
jgi:hypothetical protein